MAKRKAPDTTDSQVDAVDSEPKKKVKEPKKEIEETEEGVKEPTLWTVGKTPGPEYYYDGIFPKHVLDKDNRGDDKYWPPDLLDLSSAAIAKIALSNLPSKARAKRWPSVFNDKTVRSTYVHKGRAAKVFDGDDKKWRYSVCFGNVQLHGSEGTKGRLISKTPAEAHQRHSLDGGAPCLVQNNDETVPANATVKEIKVAKGGKKKGPAVRQTTSPKTPKARAAKKASPSTIPDVPAEVKASTSVKEEPQAPELKVKEKSSQDATMSSTKESSGDAIPSSIFGSIFGGPGQGDDVALDREGTPRSKDTASSKKRKRRRLPIKEIVELEDDDSKATDLTERLKVTLERNDKLAEGLKDVDERNSKLMRQLKDADERNESLERQLKVAEGQLKKTKEQQDLLSSTAEKIHSAAGWMSSHLGKSLQELSFIIQRLEKFLPSDSSRTITLDDMKLNQARVCVQEYKEATQDQLKSFDDSTDAFYQAYPELAKDIFGVDGSDPDHVSESPS